jgi:hypothetical protein
MNRRRHRAFVIGISLFLASFFSCRANVYATNIKLNGSLTNSWVAPGYPARISYILNEPATMGVQLQICSGTNVVKTFVATNGQPGAFAGSNAFLWDGTDSHGSNVAPGLYTLQITAGAVGYADWTNITDDGTNFEVDFARGIDVNKNTNSPYYGRVFVGNARAVGNQQQGIFKFNADGSPADEGAFSTGGYPWPSGIFIDGYTPWKIAIGPNDEVYVNDWSGQGKVIEFDELIDTNFVVALASDAYPSDTVSLSGLYITGTATTEQLWMADIGDSAPSLGIVRWDVQSDGTVAYGDTNAAVVVAVTNSDLTLAPYDLAVATNGFIYTIQRINATNEEDAEANITNRVLCFPTWTNGGAPETKAIWAIGSGDTNLVNTYGVDVNPLGTLVAVAVRGFGESSTFGSQDGNLSIFSARNGKLVKRFTLGVPGDYNDQFTDVAWDQVGNLCALDFDAGVWRAYSPPGTNQATTVGVASVEFLTSLQPPQLTQALMTTNGESFMLDGQSDVTYVVQLSTNLIDWSDVATNFDSVPNRFINLPLTTDAQDFYRAVALPNR